MSTEVATETKTKIEFAKRYKVILLNDDYTPMEFVAELLIELFNMDYENARLVTNDVHKNGRGLAGVYSKEIAEQKIDEAHELASFSGHPLKLIMELE